MFFIGSTCHEPEVTKIMVLERESQRYMGCNDHNDDNKDAETERNDSKDGFGSDLTGNSGPQESNDSVQMLEELAEEECNFSDSDRSLSEETYSSSSPEIFEGPKRSTKDDIIHYLRQKLNVMTTKYSKLKRQNNKYLTRQSSGSVSPLNLKATKQHDQIMELTDKKYIKQWATILPKMTSMKESKFFGMSQEFVLEELNFEQPDYRVIFGGKGRLVQPRPDYKPKSSVIIREFPAWRDIQDVFRKHELEEIITVNVWKNKKFSGQCEAKIDALTVWYNQPKKILRLNFKCERMWLDE